MMDILTYDFMQRAVLAGIMIGILCSFMAFFVVLKRLSFAGVGISHSAFGGVALGLYFGLNPVLAGGLFATLVAWAIGFISRRGDIEEDVSIGIFFSAAMAFGITMVGLSQGYYADLFSFLFGNILAVSRQDLLVLAGLGSLIILVLSIFFKELLFMCFDEELARVNGIPVNFLYFLLLTCLALTIIIAVKIVGIILASALLVIPAAAAHEITRDFRRMLAISIITGVASAMGGLALSYYYDLPSGATIVLLAALLFFAAFIFSPRRIRLRKLLSLGGRKDRPQEAADKQKQATEKIACH